MRGRAPQNQETSRAVDSGRNLEPSLDEAAELGARTIVLLEQQSASPPFKKLQNSNQSASSSCFHSLPLIVCSPLRRQDYSDFEFQSMGIISLLLFSPSNGLFSTQEARSFFLKHKSDYVTRLLSFLNSEFQLVCIISLLLFSASHSLFST